MKLKLEKPTTPSQRHFIKLKNNHLKKKSEFAIKKKFKKLANCSGRNHKGKITVRHKGGGHKRRYREIDFFRTKPSTGITLNIEYDPNRNAHIASIYDIVTKEFFYILAPKNLKTGDVVKSGPNIEPKTGSSLPLLNIPVGSYIHNISTKVNKPAQITRAAGTFSKVKEKKLKYSKIELSSGKHVLISNECFATIGIVSNDLIFLAKSGKAGRSRWLNKRPTVRGVAMNPVDHPHGGGEGKKSGKGMTPWGKPVKKGLTSRSRNKQIIKKNLHE